MLPNNQPMHRKNRHLTARQLSRRRIKVENSETHSQIDIPSSKGADLFYKFGKDSKVFKNGKRFLFDIDSDDIKDFDAIKFNALVSSINNPIFKAFQQDSNGNINYPVRPAKSGMLHFGIWMNNVKHYSGGRIHTLLAAHHLAEMGHKVTIISDLYPANIIKDYRFFDIEDRIEWIAGDVCFKSNWLLKNDFNNIDIVICVPRILEGFSYADKWQLPCYPLVLETPNFVRKYRGGTDGTELYWQEWKSCVSRFATNILSNPGPTIEAAKEWYSDTKFEGEFYEFPPPINTYMIDRIDAEEKNEICFIGRHVDFKCPDDVIKAVGNLPQKIKPKINFIGSHNAKVRERLMLCASNNDVKVEFFAGIGDDKKFTLIKQSKLLVIPTRFEGFGMPPAEAIYCGKPVIAYDLAITKWVYGDAVQFVKTGDVKKLGKMIRKYLSDEILQKDRAEYALEQMWSPDSNIPCLPYKCKNNYRRIFYGKNYPKFTAGVIILNGMDVIKDTLDSIYDSVEKIILVEGAVEDYAEHNPNLVNKGHSIDDTINYLKNIYIDPLNKIQVVTIEDVYPDRKSKLWKNKNEMQNAIAERIDTELYLKVDSDEVWRESDIEYLRRLFMNKPDLTVINTQRWHFWKNLDTVAIGGQWNCAESRAWRWRKDFHHPVDIKNGFNYYVDKEGRKVCEPFYRLMKIMMRMHYHLGYCRKDEHIVGKINYYKNRGIEKNVNDNYSNWKEGCPTNSTHPAGTTAMKFTGTLPRILDKEKFPDKIKVKVAESTENNISMLDSPLKK